MKFKFVIVDAKSGERMVGVPMYNSEGVRIGQLIAEYAALKPYTTPVDPNVFNAEDRRRGDE